MPTGNHADPQPVHDSFMDPPMRALWRRMWGPLPGGLRLYGGTAVALYLNHRESKDFDFAATADVVDEVFAGSIPWLSTGKFKGGPGMIDAVVFAEDPENADGGRKITVTLMETGAIVFEPRHPPLTAPNGVDVAHPIDIMACKMRACQSRGAANDHRDLAAMLRTWPDWAGKALEIVAAHAGDPAATCAAFSSPPAGAVPRIPGEDLRTLAAAAARLMDRRHRPRAPSP